MKKKRAAQALLAIMMAGTIFSAGEGYVGNADEVAQASSVNSLAKSLTKENFVSVISPFSKQIANEYDLYPSLMVAQALLESYYGQSELTQQANNLFGIKSFDGKGYVINTKEYINGKAVTVKAVFKRYNNLMESLEDYAYFLNTPRYENVHRSKVTSGIKAARNVQRDGYATDPVYAQSLINVIKTYNLTNLDGKQKTESNKINKSTSKPKVSSKKKNRNVAKKPLKIMDKASYIDGNYNESFRLTHVFNKYGLYDHVKGTHRNNKSYDWFKNLKTGSLVYVDMKAVKTHNGKKSDWYRIRFSKNGKKYWVYNKAIGFASFNYKNVKHHIHVNHGNLGVYDNVFNTRNLSRQVVNSDQVQDKTYSSDGMATYVYHGKLNTWYHISMNGRDEWINSKNISVKKWKIKHAVSKKKNKYSKYDKKNKKINYNFRKSIVFNKDRKFAYLINYQRYNLYNYIPGSARNIRKISWKNVNLPKNYRVRINLKGIRMKYNTPWYQIRIDNNNYWISGKALSFR